MESQAGRTFFVESYVAQLDEAKTAALSVRLRSAVDELRLEGRTVAWIQSFGLLEEDTYVWMVTAADVNDVALLNQRAQLSCDHVAEAYADEPLPG